MQEGVDVRSKLAELVAHHLFRDLDVEVVLAVVDLELEAHEAGQDGSSARLRSDGLGFLAWGGADDGETMLRIA